MAWIALLFAGLFEIGWAVALKKSEGFTKLGPSITMVVLLALSMGLLGFAQRTLPLGTAYAIWTGIGAAGALIFGILWFNEPATAGRIGCGALIIAGIIGLKVLTPS